MKIFRIFCLLLITFILMGCGEKQAVLKVGTKADFPPFEFKEADVLTGIDIDLAREMGKRLGYKITFVEMEFDKLIPALRNNDIDLAISALTINDQRKELVDFSIPYFSADQVVLSRSNSEIEINSDEELTRFKIGTQNGTTGQYYLQYNLVENGKLPWDQLIAYDNNNLALSALINESVDLVIMDNTAAGAFIDIKPVKICYQISTNEEYGIAMKKDCKIKTDLNTALNDLMKSSRWTEIITSYMGK